MNDSNNNVNTSGMMVLCSLVRACACVLLSPSPSPRLEKGDKLKRNGKAEEEEEDEREHMRVHVWACEWLLCVMPCVTALLER